jgi:hypothetical protein
MATTMTFSMVKQYLDAIADASGAIDGSPHKRFWNVPYQSFIDGIVPGGDEVQCKGSPTPIINKADPAQTPFYLLLTQTGGWCGFNQMPDGGPFITDKNPDYSVTLADGTTVSGDKIQADLLEWLTNGFPE